MRGFILTPTYRLVDGRPEVHLYGILESGEPCLLIDDRFRPYFFVATRDLARVADLELDVGDPEGLLTLAGDPVRRVFAPDPNALTALRQRLESREVPCFEADIRFAYRYLIDRGIRGAFEVHGHFERHRRHGLVLRDPDLQPAHWQPKLKILSIDIETDHQAKQVHSIALHTDSFERVLLVHDHALVDGEPVHSEKELLHRFLAYVEELDPDVITGWNVVDFDLAVLARVAHAHGIRFTIGRNDEEMILRRDASFTRESRAEVGGRQVLDGLALLRSAFYKLDDYKLETAAQALLGRGKLIAGDDRHHEIERLYREEPQKLVDYNLQDARLVSEILAATGLVDLAVERSLLTGMQLDRVAAAIASIDSLYLPRLRRHGRVAPSVGNVATNVPIGGGHVLDSRPGLYEDVLVFDFKSLYPSLIRTFNLDPLTLTVDPDVDAIVAPNGARFLRSPRGILPELLTELAQERESAKQAGNAVKANAIKILMNSFYGVLGATTSRLFSPPVANAVTSFGHRILEWAADLVRAAGYRVLYGDTDSLFVHVPGVGSERAEAVADELRATIGAAIDARVQREYGCSSVLDLEFEKHYLRFFLPEVRGGTTGSKKRYAGMLRDGVDDRLEIVGLEAVRRDWSPVSKRFQRTLLEHVFHERPVELMIQQFVADLRAGRFDDELVYKKALRKDLREYTKTTPPHVKAARKQGGEVGRIVAYVMTTNGPEPVGELTGAPDYEHYIDHQLAPIADAILHLRGTSFSRIIPRKGQMSLF